MTRPALALLVLLAALLACSVQPPEPETETDVMWMVIVTDTPTPTPTPSPVNTAAGVNSTGVKAFDVTPLATATERP